MQKILLLSSALLMLVSCGDDYSHSQNYANEEQIDPYREEIVREAAQRAAANKFYEKKEVEFIGESLEEIALFDSIYKKTYQKIAIREFAKVSEAREEELRNEGLGVGKAVYESHGMTNRDTYLRDSGIQSDLSKSELAIFMAGFDDGYFEAKVKERIAYEDAQ